MHEAVENNPFRLNPNNPVSATGHHFSTSQIKNFSMEMKPFFFPKQTGVLPLLMPCFWLSLLYTENSVMILAFSTHGVRNQTWTQTLISTYENN